MMDEMNNGEASFTIFLRDLSASLIEAWESQFQDEIYKDKVEISQGDIFKGAPRADAIVSPTNSFGFMEVGIDMIYSLHFGLQMQDRLQSHLRKYWNGELPIGNAVIIPAYDKDLSEIDLEDDVNQGKPIKYLISAPSMRVPEDISNTVNSYLSFRAVLRTVISHNREHADNRIKTILCPGLGTSVGRMPPKRAAMQMKSAYNAIVLGKEEGLVDTPSLWHAIKHQQNILLPEL